VCLQQYLNYNLMREAWSFALNSDLKFAATTLGPGTSVW